MGHVRSNTFSTLHPQSSILLSRIDALAQTAECWADPDAEPRHDAVHDTLHANNTFTEEATAFALNQLMALMSEEALHDLADAVDVAARSADPRPTVVIEHGADTPVDGLHEAIAAVLIGGRVRSVLPPESPEIIPAFYQTLRDTADDADGVDVACATSVDGLSDFLGQEEGGEPVFCLSTASGERPLESWCKAHGFYWIGTSVGYSVGIIDGSEPEEVRHNLAEDALLHEGAPQRSLRVVWAPDELMPDPMLQAMADFRGVFPAHGSTPGSLEMRRAFLEAADQSHAYAAGMQFLVSRGDPEPQDGAHLRWSEYDNLEQVATWIHEHADEIHAVVVRPSLAERLPESLQPEALADLGIKRVEPGHVHRLPLVTRRVRRLLDAILSAE